MFIPIKYRSCRKVVWCVFGSDFIPGLSLSHLQNFLVQGVCKFTTVDNYVTVVG